MECRNAVGAAALLPLNRPAAQFSPSRGRVGLVVYRAFDDKEASLRRCADLARVQGALVVPLVLARDRGR